MKRWTLGSVILTVALLSGSFFPVMKLLQSSEGGLPPDVEAHYSTLLQEAETQAAQNRLVEAMEAVAGIPSNSEFFDEAQQFRQTWSRDLLRLANEKYDQADLPQAINILRIVPPSSELSGQARQLSGEWAQQAKQLEAVRVAQSKGEWTQALQTLEELKNTPLYNTPSVQSMRQQLIAAAYSPGQTAASLTGNVALPPQLTAPNPQVPTPQAMEPPHLAALAVDVESALATSVPQTSTALAAVPPIPQPTSSPQTVASVPGNAEIVRAGQSTIQVDPAPSSRYQSGEVSEPRSVNAMVTSDPVPSDATLDRDATQSVPTVTPPSISATPEQTRDATQLPATVEIPIAAIPDPYPHSPQAKLPSGSRMVPMVMETPVESDSTSSPTESTNASATPSSVSSASQTRVTEIVSAPAMPPVPHALMPNYLNPPSDIQASDILRETVSRPSKVSKATIAVVRSNRSTKDFSAPDVFERIRLVTPAGQVNDQGFMRSDAPEPSAFALTES